MGGKKDCLGSLIQNKVTGILVYKEIKISLKHFFHAELRKKQGYKKYDFLNMITSHTIENWVT